MELWGTADIDAPAARAHEAETMSSAAAKAHVTARRQHVEDAEDEIRPFAGKTAPKARMYQASAKTNLDNWLQQVMREERPPNAEQHRILHALQARLKTEIAEELSETKHTVS